MRFTEVKTNSNQSNTTQEKYKILRAKTCSSALILNALLPLHTSLLATAQFYSQYLHFSLPRPDINSIQSFDNDLSRLVFFNVVTKNSICSFVSLTQFWGVANQYNLLQSKCCTKVKRVLRDETWNCSDQRHLHMTT